MIDKASEAANGYDLAEFFDRDESNAELTCHNEHSVTLRFERDTTYTTFSEDGLPDGWTIGKVRFGRLSAAVEVTLIDSGVTP